MIYIEILNFTFLVVGSRLSINYFLKKDLKKTDVYDWQWKEVKKKKKSFRKMILTIHTIGVITLATVCILLYVC